MRERPRIERPAISGDRRTGSRTVLLACAVLAATGVAVTGALVPETPALAAPPTAAPAAPASSAPGSSAAAAGFVSSSNTAGLVLVYDAGQRRQRAVPAAEAASLITQYWTPARRAAAIRLTGPTVPPAAVAATGNTPAQADARAVPSRVASPVAPARGAVSAATVNFANAEGKVYFVDPRDGLGYQCSGGTVNSGKRRLVWTAGHCVHGGPGGQWMTNWVFEPGYQQGAGWPGVFPYYQLWAQSGWFNNGDRHYDYGVGITWNNASGQRVVDTVGGNGLIINPGRPFVTAIGYPSNFLGGEIQSYCQVTLSRRSLFNSDQTLNCNRGAGASGEPWLQNYNNANQLGDIVSDNSYSLNSDHSAPEYGPYYDSDTAALYNAAENASPN